MEIKMQDEEIMRIALDYAIKAGERGDTPTASIIAHEGEILSIGENEIRSSGDCTAHAEVTAIRRAVEKYGPSATHGAVCYTTMEPCPMCAWALIEAGVERVVLGARHRQLGRKDYGSYSLETFYASTDRQMMITEGVLAEECGAMRLEWMRLRGRET
jgi:tRNA(Arg) A34 adenosine deaminase TadA